MAQNRGAITVARIWVRENVITTVLLIFILLSLVIHALTITTLLRVRSITNRQLDISAAQLAQVRQQSVRYNFPVDQTFTIDTTVTVSDTPAGTFNIDVPLNLNVPISDTVVIPINKQLPFKADIPIRTEIPIDIDLREPPLGDILQQFEDALRQLRAGL